MGTTLIFVGLVVCDGSCVLFGLNGLAGLRNCPRK
jgi:hypothetical protein